MRSLYLSLRKGFKIKIVPKATTKDQFLDIVDKLRLIPVIEFVKEADKKYYLSSIHHYKSIFKIAKENGIEIFITDKLEECVNRFNIKKQSIEKARLNDKFDSSLWTDDPTCKLLPYQAKAVNCIWRARRYLLGDDMGVGKTPTGIALICRAFENDYNRALVLCPNRLKYQWKDEILKFTKIKESDVSVVNIYEQMSCPKNIVDKFSMRTIECKTCDRCDNCKLEKYDTNFKVARQLDMGKIVIFNYELFDRMKEKLMKCGFNVFILDEATKIKNIQAAVTKAVIKFSESLDYESIVVPMSGTFIENKIDEIFPPLSLVDPGILGKFHNFKNNYLIYDYWGKIVGIRNEKRLKKLISPYIIRRSIDEVWQDRPPLIETTRTCEMTVKQRKIYEDAKAGALRELDNKDAEHKINIAEIGALLSYLIQICDTVEAIDPEVKESGKIDVLKDIVSEEISSRHKVVIFSFYANKVIPILLRELSKFGKCLVITGNVEAEEAERIKQRFIRCEDIRFLICSDSMAYGANLQVARYVINFDLPWNPAKIEQRIRRVYRKGQTKSVTVTNLVTTDSVEDNILEKIGVKRKIFDMFLGISTVKKKTLSLDDMLAVLRSK